ncbi:glutamine-hydrolyzing carbamoyl-phosphate synthase small subunit [Candidatus Peregrinibacteria bacterium]|nr:glutamine-hydrolyzing carbamoyl-phosphate synthase small subunit [Candidatus Peregrinibacteria bacterium]
MENAPRNARLLLQDGLEFSGELFGSRKNTDGEVVFTTGMVGYEQSCTDPSFRGQILVFTYPMIGNYGIASEERCEYGILKNFESDELHVKGVVTSEYSRSFSHWKGKQSFDEWLQEKGIPGISGIDTRALTEHLREHGSQKGQIVLEGEKAKPFEDVEDPNLRNLVAEVSCKKPKIYEPLSPRGKTLIVYDTGVKNNIIRSFLERGIRVIRLPWNYDLTKSTEKYDGVFFANGPGDPALISEVTSRNILFAIEKNIPFFGICLGHQLLGLAIGGKTKKMKYGHRGVNQPCLNVLTGKCVVTSQNHGFMVEDATLPNGWALWWENINDGTCEGIRHKKGMAFSVQFHPEATPGPEDTAYLFDEYIKLL